MVVLEPGLDFTGTDYHQLNFPSLFESCNYDGESQTRHSGQALHLNLNQANHLRWFDSQARRSGQDQVSILTTS